VSFQAIAIPITQGRFTYVTEHAIEVKALRKSFGNQRVLDGISFEVPRGSVFCLLGPNGAGKTTTVRILSTLIPADEGQAAVAGFDVAHQGAKVRASIGLTGQFSAVDTSLTGEENLQMIGRLLHLKKAKNRRVATELLEQFDLVDAAGKLVSSYSGGMKRRLDLAMSLVGKPKVIFLDEPTTGLDPRSRRTMWTIVRQLIAAGTSILLTTQYLEEADQLADQVAVLNNGSLVAQGTPSDLKRQVGNGHVSLKFATSEALAAAHQLFADAECSDDTLELRISSDGSINSLRAILDRFHDDSVRVESVAINTPTLDDVFFKLTGTEVAPEGTKQ
jgi:ABC-2 type transport system ATP-binding protein